MSALGQKRTLECIRAMSALPPKADIGTQPRNVCFVPKADIMRCSNRRDPLKLAEQLPRAVKGSSHNYRSVRLKMLVEEQRSDAGKQDGGITIAAYEVIQTHRGRLW